MLLVACIGINAAPLPIQGLGGSEGSMPGSGSSQSGSRKATKPDPFQDGGSRRYVK